MVESLILITTAVGVMEEVYDKVKDTENIERAAMLTGPYDVMALANAENISEIMNVLMTEIRNIEGVVNTTTCIVIG